MTRTRADRRHDRRTAKARRKLLRTFLDDCYQGETAVRPRTNDATNDYYLENLDDCYEGATD